MDIFPLSEGSFTVDRTKEFVPFNKQTDNLLERPTGSILVEVQPFLVRMKNELVLLDTGLGFKLENGNLQLHQNILKQGFNPSDVTLVLLSHLHKDHAGGLEYAGSDGIVQPTFKNARYCIYQKEMDLALSGKSTSYFPAQYALIQNHPQLHYLNGQSGEIKSRIFFEHTGAHSPEHIAYKLIEDGQVFFFGGDVAPQLQQMKNRFVAKYDFDGRKSMQLRTKWKEQGIAGNWTFLFYHDIKYPTHIFSS